MRCNASKKENSLSRVCEMFDHTKHRIWKQHYNILVPLKSWVAQRYRVYWTIHQIILKLLFFKGQVHTSNCNNVCWSHLNDRYKGCHLTKLVGWVTLFVNFALHFCFRRITCVERKTRYWPSPIIHKANSYWQINLSSILTELNKIHSHLINHDF